MKSSLLIAYFGILKYIFCIIKSSWLIIISIELASRVSSSLLNPSVVDLCSGHYHNCALFEDKSVKCWGLKQSFGLATLNDHTSLGSSSDKQSMGFPYLDVGTDAKIDKVSCGQFHVCLKLDKGDMKCLGKNGHGQIGIGVTSDPIGEVTGFFGDKLPAVDFGTDLKVIDIALGAKVSCALLNGFQVKCFGHNKEGGLGIGDDINRGTSLGQMGNNLSFVKLGLGVEVFSIHSGSKAEHFCAVLSKPNKSAQRVKCWGLNDYSQLGYGDFANRGHNSVRMNDNLPLVDFGGESRVKSIALGWRHSCAILLNDNLKCYGASSYGQLGLGITNTTVTYKGDTLPIVELDPEKTIKSVSTGYLHTCIVYDDLSTMKCFGDNTFGQLGQGDTLDRGDTPTSLIPFIPSINLGSNTEKISSVHSGSNHNCVVFISGQIKCFGNNLYGQLAIGTTQSVGDSRNEMGIYLKYPYLFSKVELHRHPGKISVLSNSPKSSTSNSTVLVLKSGLYISILGFVMYLTLIGLYYCRAKRNHKFQHKDVNHKAEEARKNESKYFARFGHNLNFN